MGTQLVEASYYIAADGADALAGAYTGRTAAESIQHLVTTMEQADPTADASATLTVYRPFQQPRRLGRWTGIPAQILAELHVASRQLGEGES